MDPEAQETTMFHNFYADYYTMAGIAVASSMALCPAVGLMGRRGGLLMFMIITALASLLQLGLLNRECLLHVNHRHSWKMIQLSEADINFFFGRGHPAVFVSTRHQRNSGEQNLF